MDRATTVAQLKRLVERFVRERDWEQFHTPKNLSMGLAVEAAELMELFQWYDAEGSVALMRRANARRAALMGRGGVLFRGPPSNTPSLN